MRPTALCAALRLKAAKRRRLRITDTLLYSLDYDRDGIIDEYVVRYLSALRDAGADICFITSTAAPKELEKIRQFVFRIIIKNDAGRDFGSWYLALESIQTSLRERYAYVLFINDSVYFPVVDCGRMFAQMAASKLDLWGITDSRQCGYHLQSYFLGFSRNARRPCCRGLPKQSNQRPT